MEDIRELKQRTIHGELVKIGIREDIASVANDIYSRSGKHFSSNKEKTNILLYDCCYAAYLQIGEPINPIVLGKRFGVSPKKSTSIKTENVFVSPSVYVDECCVGYDLNKNERSLLTGMCEIIDSCPPPTTAIVAGTAATIIFMNKLNPYWWNSEEIKRLIEKSTSSAQTIKKAMTLINSKHGAEISKLFE